MNEQLKEKINEVLQAVKIEEVISDYIQLKRVGKRYAGVCPFHNDRDPSLSVNTEKGFFLCFGCGVGGNAINFVMKAENISFKGVDTRNSTGNPIAVLVMALFALVITYRKK